MYGSLVTPVHVLHIVPQHHIPAYYEDRLSFSYCHSHTYQHAQFVHETLLHLYHVQVHVYSYTLIQNGKC